MSTSPAAAAPRLSASRRQLIWVGLLVVVGVITFTWVDLAPRVEADFFFSPDDPQLQATEQISAAFGSGQQILIRAQGPDIEAESYRYDVRALTLALEGVPGVQSVNSVTNERAEISPLWGRLLLPPGGEASNLVLRVGSADPEILVPQVEAILGASESADFSLAMSGVPVIVHLIRRSLTRDLVLFSTLALLVFGILVAVVYREARVVAGTLVVCGLACGLTLVINQAVGLSIGLLTVNIVTIVFVVTLSHVVFLTANARRFGWDDAVRKTLPGSFWAMATTLLGFLSLVLANARPLRELGLAGAIGTAVALVVVYLVYPAFLQGERSGGPAVTPTAPAPRRLPAWGVGVIALLVLAMGAGLLRLNTDPGLLTYFQPGSELRDGLAAIDRDGGSSTLDIVVRDGEGGRLDQDAANNRMWAFQDSLEAMPEVGVVLSPPVLFGHARLQPFANLVPLSSIADLLESDALGGVGRSVLSEDRSEGRFSARMHEEGHVGSRGDVIRRIEGAARGAGLDVVLIGGVYDLQRQLGSLIASSLRVGLGGLLALFLVIGLVVTGRVPTAVVMLFCLIAIPLVVLGAFGHLRVPIDMITSPAANVALALGVDSMLHLAIRAKAVGSWDGAALQMRQPILAGTLIVCLGFGIFAFSSFPPTARFGMAVILGTVTAATMALVVLPRIAPAVRGTEASASDGASTTGGL